MNKTLLGPAVSHSLAYRADVDGLRGIAILLVVLFHLDLKAFAGGFVGVDVFFVLSGYLITSILLADLDKGRFSLRRFYLRRIRRIIPALAAVAFVTLLVAARIFSPAIFVSFSQSLLAMSGFVSNLYFSGLAVGHGYFAPPPLPQPLIHTWSIAVEEQFYLFFPIALLLLTRCLRRYRLALLLAGFAASLAFSVWYLHHNPVGAFYLLPSRIWEFLIGSVLALRLLPAPRSRLVREALGLTGLAAIAFAAFTYTSATPFPALSALPPCLGTALLLYIGERAANSDQVQLPSLATSLLRLQPLVFLGIISYSLYLWHWPIIVFTRYLLALPSYAAYTPLQLALLLLGALLVALLSYRFIELPFRVRDSRVRTPHLLVLAAGSTALLAASALLAIQTHGLPQRFDRSTRALIQANLAREKDSPFVDDCDNFPIDPQRFEDAHFCHSGPAAHNILFWGDSQTSQMQSTLEQMQREGAWPGRGLVFATYSGCPPTEHMNVIPGTNHCDEFASFALARALAPDIDTVFLQILPWWIYGKLCTSDHGRCLQPLTYNQIIPRFEQELTTHIEELKAAGKHVILCLPFPGYEDSVPEFQVRNAILGRLTPVPDPHLTVDEMRSRELAIARRENITVFDPRLSLCPGESCLYQANGVSLYADAQHLALSQMGILKPNLLATIH